jgi:hypothetical protein
MQIDDGDTYKESQEHDNLKAIQLYIQNNMNISEAFVPDLKIYPNPADNQLFIESSVSLQWTLLNSKGIPMLSGDNAGVVDLLKLNKGIYLLKVQYNDKIIMYKIIKK